MTSEVSVSRAVEQAHSADDNCFDCHSQAWRNNVVIAFGTLSSLLTQLDIMSGVVCVVCPFSGDAKLKTFISI